MRSIAMPDKYCTSAIFLLHTGHSTIFVRISGFSSSILALIFSIYTIVFANVIDKIYKNNNNDRFYLYICVINNFKSSMRTSKTLKNSVLLDFLS